MLNPNNPNDIPSFEKTRNIVKEIIDFGVSQKEILKIVELLALELENRNLMLEILSVVTDKEQKQEKEKLIF
tara:strand:- start:187 stop:402 length:216 start_codon:yes stop_codon:yes gene_type:complete